MSDLGGQSTISVAAEPQFVGWKTLRPFEGFEAVYQGGTVLSPIQCTEVELGTGGTAIDPLAEAGTPGYAPNLIKGLPCVLGQRCMVKLPLMRWDPTGALDLHYNWVITWRDRSVIDNRKTGQPYHNLRQGPGIPDTTSGSPLPRVVVPASWHTIPYAEAEPSPPPAPGSLADNKRYIAKLRIDDFSSRVQVNTPVTGGGLLLPLLPDGTNGAYQQGVMDPASLLGALGNAESPGAMTIEMQCAGDELLVGVYRDDPGGAPTWDFAGNDVYLSYALGNGSGEALPDLGVKVSFGIAP